VATITLNVPDAMLSEFRTLAEKQQRTVSHQLRFLMQQCLDASKPQVAPKAQADEERRVKLVRRFTGLLSDGSITPTQVKMSYATQPKRDREFMDSVLDEACALTGVVDNPTEAEKIILKNIGE
jgi:hypothetical protein